MSGPSDRHLNTTMGSGEKKERKEGVGVLVLTGLPRAVRGRSTPSRKSPVQGWLSGTLNSHARAVLLFSLPSFSRVCFFSPPCYGSGARC